MKLKEVLTANEPLKRLSEKRFTNYKKMREIVSVRKAVEQEVSFYTEEEKKLIKAYGELNKDGSPVFLSDGRLRLKNIEAKVAFEKEINALRETEIDSIQPITVSEGDFRSNDDLPTPNDMLALETVVVFEE